MNLISVIVPIYNVEKYLNKCIDSIINQTYKNIEIILINDGSTDRSYELCTHYAKKDGRIKLINKKNGGLSDARNKGLEIAKGEYAVFIDSDDWIDRSMLEKLYDLSIKYNADIVQGDYVKVYSDDDSIINDINNIEVNCYSPEQALELLYSEKCVKTVVTWNKLYKRTLFNGINFPKGKIHEDEFTTYKLLHKANIVVDTNIPIYYYRQREGSIMKSDFSIRRLDALEALMERKEYFKNFGLKKLEYMTESLFCSYLKTFYIKVKNSNICNKGKVMEELKIEMKKNYIQFIKNKEITIKGKITLTICILSDYIFFKVYRKYIN